MQSQSHRPPRNVGRRWPFVLILLASLIVSVGQPLTADFFGDQTAFEIGLALLILAVFLLVFEQRRHWMVALMLAIAVFVGIGAGRITEGATSVTWLVASHLLTTLLFAIALIGVIRTILLGHAWSEAILGAVCGYLLLGIIWSLLYAAVETAAPGSFLVASREGLSESASRASRSDLGYYSFITLSTVGYGDVTPLTPLARTLAWLEAVAGQFYLAVLVAGLVGFRVSRGQDRFSATDPPPRSFAEH